LEGGQEKKLKKEFYLDLEQQGHQLNEASPSPAGESAILENVAQKGAEPKNDNDDSNQNPREFYELLAHVHSLDPALAGIILDANLAGKRKEDS
jgi:hypothetical protein